MHQLYIRVGRRRYYASVTKKLCRCLRERFDGFHVGTTEEIGINPDAKEVHNTSY